MDVRKHGNSEWQPTHSTEGDLTEGTTAPVCETNKYTQGEHGKTELSLVHFTLTNPEWKMPSDAHNFMNGLRRHAQQDFNRARQTGLMNTAMGQSLFSVGNLGGQYSSIVDSLMMPQRYDAFNMGTSHGFRNSTILPHNMDADMPAHGYDFNRMMQQHLSDGASIAYRSNLHNIQEIEQDENAENPLTPDSTPHHQSHTSVMMGSVIRHVSHHEGPTSSTHDRSLFHSLYGQTGAHEPTNSDLTTADMCLSTLYLHELFHRQSRRRSGTSVRSPPPYQPNVWQLPHRDGSQPPSQSQSHMQPNTSPYPDNVRPAAEKTPLLHPKKT